MQQHNLLDGKLAVRPFEALLVAGISSTEPSARNTARNYLAREKFPFPTRRIGKTLVVLVSDLMAGLGLADADAGDRPAFRLTQPAAPTLHPQTIACAGQFKAGRPAAWESDAARECGQTVPAWRRDQLRLLGGAQ